MGRCSSSSNSTVWGTRGGRGRPCRTSSMLPKNGGSRPRTPRASYPRWVRSATVAIVTSGAWGRTLENVLPNYGNTMLAHGTVASNYPTQTMVQATRTPDFLTPKPKAASGAGSSGSQLPPSALVTVLRSIWNSVPKIATFVHYICELCREIRTSHAPRPRTQRFRQSRFSRDFGALFSAFCCAFPDRCESHLESAANYHRLHPSHYDATCNLLPPVSCQRYIVLMPHGTGAKRRTPSPPI